MKFSVNRQQFLDRLSKVNRAINVNSSIPALTGTKVDVYEDHIVLTGADSSLIIRSEIWPGELTGLRIDEPGSLVMDFRYALEILRSMDSDALQVETLDNNLIRITDASGEYNLNTMDVKQYPPVNLATPEHHFKISARILRDVFNQVAYAVSEKDTRLILTGVNLNNLNGSFYCSATDSYRLARKHVLEAPDLEFDITLPRKAFQEVVRMAEGDAPIDVYLDNKRIQFLFDKNLIQSQLLEGRYPNVEKIIPSAMISTLQTNAQELERILRRATMFKADNTSFLATMKMDQDHITITTDTSQVGSSEQVLYQADYTGEPLVVSLNGKFMLQAIQGLQSNDRVRLDFTGALKPIRITNPQDDSVVMVVVPMRSF